MRINIFTLMIYLLSSTLYSQSYINVQGHYNYWQHTAIFGPGVGFGYSYKFSNLNISLNYDYGYGAINRFKNIENIDYNNWTTIFIKEQKGKWNEYLGFTTNLSNEIKGSSDYGKQHQISMQVGYSFLSNKGMELELSTGLYAAIVEHFYTFTNIPIHYIEVPATYSGPLNYIPATSQKIATYGVNFELSLSKIKSCNIYTPFIIVGLGPKYSSYCSVGMRLSTQLQKRKKE